MKKFTSLLLVAAMMLLLCACGSDSDSDSGKRRKRKGNNTEYTEEAYTQEPETEKFFDSSRVQKIGTSERSGHAYYDMDTKLYGILSADGKVDTGAKYASYSYTYTDDYYEARTKKYGAANDFDSINCVELLDPNAKTLVSGFCHYEIINDRFFVAAKVISINENGQGDFTYETADGSVSYDAEFYVYDVEENKIVDNVMSYEDSIRVSGCFIYFKNTDGEYKAVNVNGFDVPEDARFISHLSYPGQNINNNGYYKVFDDDGNGFVYNDYNELVYRFNTRSGSRFGYEPSNMENGYFYGLREYDEDISNYRAVHVLLNESFNAVSAEIKRTSSHTQIGIYKEVFLIRDIENNGPYRLYNHSGNVVYETQNELMCKVADGYRAAAKYVLFHDGNDDVIMDPDSNFIYKNAGEVHAEFDHTAYSAYREIGEERYYYCIKDNDFTVKTQKFAHLAPYLVKVEAEDGTQSVVDLVTGETVISGYEDYYARTVGKDAYIFANNKNGTSDIYYAAFAE